MSVMANSEPTEIGTVPEPLWSAPGTPAWPDADRVAVTGCVDLTVPGRFQGPDGMGNGGWVAGAVASTLPAGPAEVTLRAPTPLDVALHCEFDGRTSRLFAPGAGVVIAVATPVTDVPQPPPVVSVEAAEQASKRFVGYVSHPFPRCVVCGPERPEGDGLRIFPGTVEGMPEEVAAPWTVAASLADADGRVPTEVVWSALDCATGWAHLLPGAVALLGRLAVSVIGEVVAGNTYVVVARASGRSGRKAFADAALYDVDGTLLANSRATWISIG